MLRVSETQGLGVSPRARRKEEDAKSKRRRARVSETQGLGVSPRARRKEEDAKSKRRRARLDAEGSKKKK